jgi:hypothetical protein
MARGVLMLAVGEKKPRQQPCQIAQEDEQKEGGDVGEKAAAFLAGDLHHELFQAADHQFKDVLSPRRHQGNAAAGQESQAQQNEHDEPGIGDMGRDVEIESPGQQIKKQNGMFHVTGWPPSY